MDIVQRIHEEMRADLVAQICDLMLQVLLFEHPQPCSIRSCLEIDFRAQVGGQKQHRDHDFHDERIRGVRTLRYRRQRRTETGRIMDKSEAADQNETEKKVECLVPFHEKESRYEEIMDQKQYQVGYDRQQDRPEI